MLKKIIHFGICLVVLSLPLYLLKVKIYWIPFTVLELMIYGLFVLWLIHKVIASEAKQSRGKSNGIASSPVSWRAPRNDVAFKLYLPVFLIFLGLTISTLFSVDPQVSAGIWKGWFIAPWLFFIVLLDSAQSQKQIKDILIALTVSGGGVAIIGLWSWFFGDLTYDGRLKAFYLSPNHLAMYLAPILILSFGLWGFLKTIWQKVLLLAVSCLLLVVIYLTYSYGAWIGVMAGLLFLLVIKGARDCPKMSLRGRSPKQSRGKFGLTTGLLRFARNDKMEFSDSPLPLVPVVFIALLFIVLIFSQLQAEKAQNLFNFSRSSLESRLIIWRTAIEIIKDQPLIGIGPGMFQKYYLAYQPKFKPYLEWAAPQPHNLFLAFWLQTGLIGLIGFIWLMVRFFSFSSRLSENLITVIARRRSRRSNPVAKPNFYGIASGFALAMTFSDSLLIFKAALAYILIHGLADTTYWKNDLAIIFWLIIALGSILSRLSYSQKINSPLGAREEAE